MASPDKDGDVLRSSVSHIFLFILPLVVPHTLPPPIASNQPGHAFRETRRASTTTTHKPCEENVHAENYTLYICPDVREKRKKTIHNRQLLSEHGMKFVKGDDICATNAEKKIRALVNHNLHKHQAGRWTPLFLQLSADDNLLQTAIQGI